MSVPVCVCVSLLTFNSASTDTIPGFTGGRDRMVDGVRSTSGVRIHPPSDRVLWGTNDEGTHTNTHSRYQILIQVPGGRWDIRNNCVWVFASAVQHSGCLIGLKKSVRLFFCGRIQACVDVYSQFRWHQQRSDNKIPSSVNQTFLTCKDNGRMFNDAFRVFRGSSLVWHSMICLCVQLRNSSTV